MEIIISREAIKNSIDRVLGIDIGTDTKDLKSDLKSTPSFTYYLDDKQFFHFDLEGTLKYSPHKRVLKPIHSIDKLLTQGYSHYKAGLLSRTSLLKLYCNELETLLRLKGHQTLYTK